MNSQLAKTLTSLGLLVHAFFLVSGLSAQTGSAGKVTGQAPTSTGATTADFAFPIAQAAVSPGSQREFTVVPLPVGHFPEALGHDGSVLLYNWNTASFVRWKSGQMTAVPIGTNDRVNEYGEILRELSSGGYVLEKTDGSIVNVNFDLGPLSLANASDFSSKFAVGYMAMEMAQGFPRYAPVKWDFAGTYTQLAPMHAPLESPSFQPTQVNERGDFVAQKFPDSADAREGTFLNDRFFAGFSGFYLNNKGEMLLVDRYMLNPPVYWNGSSHLISSNPGWAILMNDQGEILGNDFDGSTLSPVILWTPAVDAEGNLSFTATDLQAALGLTIDSVRGINNLGMILLAAWNANGDYQSFLLVPKTDKLGVDFDRDGIINNSRDPANPDRELARRQLPWCFWVNDDNDAGETDGNDIPGDGANGADGQVNGVRDLVDFFPVHLDIAGLLGKYPAIDPSITYRLAQADGAANYLPTELTPGTAGNYHHDVEFAGTLGAGQVIQITDGGVILDPAFLGKILTADGGIILVEARKPSKAPLRLEVWRNGLRVDGVELPLSFAGIETMFRHRNLVNAVSVHPDTPDRPGTPNWPDELNNNQVFAFVHGYNVNQKQARGWQAEFFKRLWWTGSKAQFWGVTWYGTESQKTVGSARITANYHANVIHAFGTAPHLARFLTSLRDSTGAPPVINVAGHSLGNMVVSSAISDHAAPVARYFMLDAAVAAEAYDGSVAANNPNRVVQPDDATAVMPHSDWNRGAAGVYPDRLWPTNWHQVFVSLGPVDHRAKLTWRDRFVPRAGVEYYDFHSTGEEVLDFTNNLTPSLTLALLTTTANALGEYLHFTLPFGTGQPAGHRTWQLQEQLKGRTITGKILGSNYGGWGFNTLFFKRSPGGSGGRGPILTPGVLKPAEATAMLDIVFTPEALREEPFFRPGGDRRKVGSWHKDAQDNPVFLEENLGLLYGPTTGSEFASRHRSALLARMIPAMSPAAGRIAVPRLKPATSTQEHNFDMNGVTIRPGRNAQGNPLWPQTRGGDFRWWHSDLREVAYPYVRGLYERITAAGDLGGTVP